MISLSYSTGGQQLFPCLDGQYNMQVLLELATLAANTTQITPLSGSLGSRSIFACSRGEPLLLERLYLHLT